MVCASGWSGLRRIGRHFVMIVQIGQPPGEIDTPASDTAPHTADGRDDGGNFFVEFTHQGLFFGFTFFDATAWKHNMPGAETCNARRMTKSFS